MVGDDMNSNERKKRDLIAEARGLIAHTRTYNFGMWSADKLAHEVAPALADALEALTVPDGDAREVREIAIEGVKIDARGRMRHDSRVWYEALESALDALLPEFWDKATASALSRDIAGEIEAEALSVVSTDEGSPHYRAGLERALEIARAS